MSLGFLASPLFQPLEPGPKAREAGQREAKKSGDEQLAGRQRSARQACRLAAHRKGQVLLGVKPLRAHNAVAAHDDRTSSGCCC